MAVSLHNDHLKNLQVDYLYHLGLNTGMNLKEIFGDIKFVITGGSADRMHALAVQIAKELQLGIKPEDIKPIGKTERYSLFKVGPAICVNHGMGCPSISILLHEIAKLLHYIGAKDPILIRVGTSGGLNLEPGTVVVTTEALNPRMEPCHELWIMGKCHKRPTTANPELVEQLVQSAVELNIPVAKGKTFTTDCFYEGQARTDGSICEYTQEERAEFIKELISHGVANVEMEGSYFLAFCHKMGLKGAVCCVTLLNRSKGDQVTLTPDQLAQFSERSIEVVVHFMKSNLGTVKAEEKK
eukprot:TRINITY_DN2648_c0_g1_i1.p1 TRINITY_DN2648_c0_g1~~TRINITY_DN2648_c0_g1_i1.p1  ORF type:complete len:319 (-),score=81.92 TRINITY_DN2648_c0_g1_i1:123-1016(-)